MTQTILGQIGSLLLRHKLVTAIGVLGLLFYGYYWLMIPRGNPNPTKKVVVRGTFPYDQGWELRIVHNFYTSNPTCKQTARVFLIFPAAEVSRDKKVSVAVKQETGNRFIFEYDDDYFLPGYCEWTSGFVTYRIYSNKDMLHGGAILGFPQLYNKIDYDCSGMKMPRTGEVRIGCYEGNSHNFDPLRKYGEVNFFWKGEGK